MSSIYTICETGSFQRDEKMEQDASVQSSSDIVSLDGLFLEILDLLLTLKLSTMLNNLQTTVPNFWAKFT